jgi:hypothetical protein
MGIGIHTGQVIVGNIGSLRRTKYSAVGSNVNLTGRIESFTTGGQVLISESTREKLLSPVRIDAQFQVEPKGAASRLLLLEVGGIGEPYGLSLPVRNTVLHPLPTPLQLGFTILEEKFVGRTIYRGQLIAVSGFEAVITSELVPATLCNLKLTVDPVSGGTPGGEIYAKVLGLATDPSGGVRIRFTSVSPELKAFITQTVAGLAKSAQPSGSDTP